EFMVFARQHPKPIMVGEYGAQEQKQDPAAKPFWMRHAHDTLMDKPKTAECKYCGAYSDVAAVVYFDVNYGSHGDWRIMSSQESLVAYKEAAGDPWFHQLHTVPWPPHANRQQTQQTGQDPSSDQASQPSDPGGQPPDQSTQGPPPDQASQPSDPDTQPSDPASPPPDQADQPPDQAGQPDPATPPDSASQPDQGGGPPDQASQPDQGAGQADQAGQKDRTKQSKRPDKGGKAAAQTQRPEPAGKGHKNR
ncbi:MAG TPA: hypothetical protein VG034_28065, partial [Acidimicrobiia bacterium]|nr:hypothetical protein [Acidimicrobiia bacterium]